MNQRPPISERLRPRPPARGSLHNAGRLPLAAERRLRDLLPLGQEGNAVHGGGHLGLLHPGLVHVGAQAAVVGGRTRPENGAHAKDTAPTV
jgi:hypothetical protein